MNLKYDIQTEIILITEKMDNINKANLNIPNLSTPFSHIRSPVKPKVETKHNLMEELSQHDNNHLLIEEAPQLKAWSAFTGEGKDNNVSFIKIIHILKEDYAIPDELIMAKLHSLSERSENKWYYFIRK
ncbi:hypothetical protein O181_003296 [Austropuccinia psidii MF-1]|uniref:Uncharacterized protein n=1 Tax=Austropuccinia psidii MF-1 TaxID=1389203 RepID=A0A9Q3BEP7_9BASI|nr:hypothetical protein [Austropuccinia psidii MF-1]